MQAALNLIEGGLTCQHEDITECPHYQALVAANGTFMTCCSAWRPQTTLTPAGAAGITGQWLVLAVLCAVSVVAARLVQRC